MKPSTLDTHVRKDKNTFYPEGWVIAWEGYLEDRKKNGFQNAPTESLQAMCESAYQHLKKFLREESVKNMTEEQMKDKIVEYVYKKYLAGTIRFPYFHHADKSFQTCDSDAGYSVTLFSNHLTYGHITIYDDEGTSGADIIKTMFMESMDKIEMQAEVTKRSELEQTLFRLRLI